ncbi:unnamed protein product [Caenorhabditis auriculariae]|uniref:Uncharacterized protein n=1 Tax=Caenorhabditis auriculariae TaxID=2777116 RepID=A0A8S1HSI3_9PELO|nr:unnamed protein product [Caenorhabditis auriculariae]
MRKGLFGVISPTATDMDVGCLAEKLFSKKIHRPKGRAKKNGPSSAHIAAFSSSLPAPESFPPALQKIEPDRFMVLTRCATVSPAMRLYVVLLLLSLPAEAYNFTVIVEQQPEPVQLFKPVLLPVPEPEPKIDDVTKILEKLGNYNRNAYPNQDSETPTLVDIQMYIEGMSSFHAQSMDFQVDIYFQQKWIDKRLVHNNTKRILIKDTKLFDLIWHPDIYFANARTAAFHDVTQPNFLVWIYGNGTVWYDCRISMTVLCMQNLARYPLDSQGCGLRILSYAYDTEQLQIRWNGRVPVEVNKDIRMPDMRLQRIKFYVRNDSYATGIWSCAIAEFHVDREITHHIIQSYIPTALIVIISWFSFWLDVEAVPGRVSLSITTLLTLATQSSAARMALPQASYVKAIDVWMGTCMAFVFSAMIEFTVVNYCTRRKQRKKPRKRGLTEQVQDLVMQYKEKKNDMFNNGNACYEVSVHGGDNLNVQRNFEKKQLREMNQSPLLVRRNMLPSFKRKAIEERINRVEENRKFAQSIDRYSRIYFPVAFIVFNIVYWVYYLRYDDGREPKSQNKQTRPNLHIYLLIGKKTKEASGKKTAS